MSVKKAKKKNKKWKVGPLILLVILVFGALWLFTIFSEYQNKTGTGNPGDCQPVKRKKGDPS